MERTTINELQLSFNHPNKQHSLTMNAKTVSNNANTIATPIDNADNWARLNSNQKSMYFKNWWDAHNSPVYCTIA